MSGYKETLCTLMDLQHQHEQPQDAYKKALEEICDGKGYGPTRGLK